jgi:hypothetical protein
MPNTQKTLKSTARDDHETVTINVPLPHDLHTRLRVKAATDGTTLKQSVIEALREWTKRR